MSFASRLCITFVFWQLGDSNAVEVQSCEDAECSASKTPLTIRSSSLLQMQSATQRKILTQRKAVIKGEWGFFKKAAKWVDKAADDAVDWVEEAADDVVDFVEDAKEEAVSVAEDVVEDIGNAAESAIEELHDNIVEGFGTLVKFLEEHVDVAWKMLGNIFSCLVNVIAEGADCPATWARQAAACVTGKGCAISIGHPKCSSLSTEEIVSMKFLQTGEMNETAGGFEDEPAGSFEIEIEAVDKSVYQQTRRVLSDHKLADNVVLDLEHLENEYLNETEIDPSVGPSEDEHSVNESEIQLLQDFSEKSRMMVVNWTDQSRHISQLQAHSMTPSLTTSGHASVGAGGHLHVNTDTGNVRFQFKVELNFQGTLAAGVARASSKDMRKRYIVHPRQLMQKVVMAGKIPIKVALKVGLVQQAGLSANGAFNVELVLKQRFHATFECNFNIKHLNRNPDCNAQFTYWNPDNDLRWNGHGQLTAWYQVAPEVQVTINEVPFSQVYGPKWLANADVQGSSSGCSRATFALDSTLAGRFVIAPPSLPLKSIVSNNCNLMAQTLTNNPAVKAASCVTKAAFDFDPVQATKDACAAMESIVPEFEGEGGWEKAYGASRLKLVDFPASKMCSSSQNCKHIRAVTKSYGSENSWTLGSCSGPQGGRYGSHRHYEFGNCCLSGRQTLTCKDSYGDGWHGGYLEIGGVKYCQGFTTGRSRTETLVF